MGEEKTTDMNHLEKRIACMKRNLAFAENCDWHGQIIYCKNFIDYYENNNRPEPKKCFMNIDELIKLAEDQAKSNNLGLNWKGYGIEAIKAKFEVHSMYAEKLKQLKEEMDKPKEVSLVFFIDEVRKLLHQWESKELSLSKLTEILNEKATGLDAPELYKIIQQNIKNKGL